METAAVSSASASTASVSTPTTTATTPSASTSSTHLGNQDALLVTVQPPSVSQRARRIPRRLPTNHVVKAYDAAEWESMEGEADLDRWFSIHLQSVSNPCPCRP
jgi:hypothetical protein